MEEDSSDDMSQGSPLPGGIGICIKSQDPQKSPSRRSIPTNKHIGIEMRLSSAENVNESVIEVSPSEPGADFLSGPAPLLTRTDFMHMIQEGIRIALSETARNNDIRVIRTQRTVVGSGPPPSIPVARSSSTLSSSDPSKKRMKYIMHQYKPKSFQQMREMHNISTPDFLDSLCNSDLLGGWTESSGKSGSLFWYSSDRKYIMKSITAEETHLMNSMIGSYLRYIRSHPHTLLCKFFGMFKISTYVAAPSYMRGQDRPSRIRSDTLQTTRFVVMNNVFEYPDIAPPTATVEKFDLKGTTEDRYVRPVTGKEVLKDLNFGSRIITLPRPVADCLTQVIKEDCHFLLHHGIMDYSLILGVREGDDETQTRLSSAWTSDPEWQTRISNHHGKSPSGFATKVKAAVHKLLSPFPHSATSSRRSCSHPPHDPVEAASIGRVSSGMPSIIEEDSPPATRKSVFTAFQGGVAGWKDQDRPAVYYLGIIDILQQYTMKKKAAHCIKKFSIGCCHEIDTVAPKRYRQRFEQNMVSKIRLPADNPAAAL